MKPTPADYDSFYGFEFNWFAIDSSGVISLFSTAGYGEIPGSVMQHEQAHRALSEQLDLPN